MAKSVYGCGLFSGLLTEAQVVTTTMGGTAGIKHHQSQAKKQKGIFH